MRLLAVTPGIMRPSTLLVAWGGSGARRDVSQVEAQQPLQEARSLDNRDDGSRRHRRGVQHRQFLGNRGGDAGDGRVHADRDRDRDRDSEAIPRSARDVIVHSKRDGNRC